MFGAFWINPNLQRIRNKLKNAQSNEYEYVLKDKEIKT